MTHACISHKRLWFSVPASAWHCCHNWNTLTWPGTWQLQFCLATFSGSSIKHSQATLKIVAWLSLSPTRKMSTHCVERRGPPRLRNIVIVSKTSSVVHAGYITGVVVVTEAVTTGAVLLNPVLEGCAGLLVDIPFKRQSYYWALSPKTIPAQSVPTQCSWADVQLVRCKPLGKAAVIKSVRSAGIRVHNNTQMDTTTCPTRCAPANQYWPIKTLYFKIGPIIKLFCFKLKTLYF